jgi:hypothetical protein
MMVNFHTIDESVKMFSPEEEIAKPAPFFK